MSHPLYCITLAKVTTRQGLEPESPTSNTDIVPIDHAFE